MIKQLLLADSIPGRPWHVSRPHYMWMDGAMQDLSTLGPRLQLDLLRAWPNLAAGPGFLEGGCQPVLALPVLLQFFYRHQVFNSSLAVL